MELEMFVCFLFVFFCSRNFKFNSIRFDFVCFFFVVNTSYFFLDRLVVFFSFYFCLFPFSVLLGTSYPFLLFYFFFHFYFRALNAGRRCMGCFFLSFFLSFFFKDKCWLGFLYDWNGVTFINFSFLIYFWYAALFCFLFSFLPSRLERAPYRVAIDDWNIRGTLVCFFFQFQFQIIDPKSFLFIAKCNRKTNGSHFHSKGNLTSPLYTYNLPVRLG